MSITTATINVGLARNDGSSNHVDRTIMVLVCAGLTVDETYQLRQSETEPTLVVDVTASSYQGIIGALYLACGELAQDCIAVKFSTDTGLLVGPNAVKWGEFNPAYFLE